MSKAAVSEILADCLNSIFGHEVCNLKKGPKVAYVLSFYPRGLKLSFFSLYGLPFSRYRPIFKISIFGHEIRNLNTGPKIAYVPFFYPRGSKLSLFLLYGQRFPRYRPIFKIAIVGHETWPLAKAPEVAYILSFYPRGVEIELILCSTGIGFQNTIQFYNLPYLGMKLGKWPKFQKLYVYAPSTPGGRN